MNSNPGLTYGQVPSPAQWNGYFSAKQDYSPVLDALIAAGGEGSVTAETARAEAAEAANAALIAAETTRAETAEALRATTASLTSETTRAEAAEGANTTAITAETARAEAAEGANATAIAAETTRAEAAEALKATPASVAAAIAASAISTANNVGRNKLLNSLCNIAQRGAGPFTANGYCLDQFKIISAHSTGSLSVSQVALADANRTAIGDEETENAVAYTFTGGTGASDFDNLGGLIEDVRRLSGKTVQVSFWGKCSSGTCKVGVSIDQNFGTGGTSPAPSATVIGAGSYVTLTTTMARYTVPIAVPSASGKTIGTTPNTSFSQLNLWLSAGTSYANNSGTIGVQSSTVTVWGRQLEIGSTATAVEKLDQSSDIARCKRYYNIFSFSAGGGATAAGIVMMSMASWPDMRGAPTVGGLIGSSSSTANASAASVGVYSANSGYFQITATAAGECYVLGAAYPLSAEL